MTREEATKFVNEHVTFLEGKPEEVLTEEERVLVKPGVEWAASAEVTVDGRRGRAIGIGAPGMKEARDYTIGFVRLEAKHNLIKLLIREA